MKIPAWMIFLGASAFLCVAAGLGLVYVSSQSAPHLVRGDYYEAGLHLDDQRVREAGFDSLNIRLMMSEGSGSLVLEGHEGIPIDSNALRRLKSYGVKLYLQRPDDPAADREMVLRAGFATTPGDLPRWSTSASPLHKGRWNCRVVFETGGTPRFEHSFAYNASGGS